jgi:hypothetical protein
MLIKPATVSDTDAWLAMREDLWPGSKKSHAEDIQRFFAGKLREPLQVLIAFDEHGKPAGFIELSIRAYAEGCVSDAEVDNVASAAAHRAVGFEETGAVRCYRKVLS